MICTMSEPNEKKKQMEATEISGKDTETMRLILKTFLNNSSKMPSHFCKKLYLEHVFGSKGNI